MAEFYELAQSVLSAPDITTTKFPTGPSRDASRGHNLKYWRRQAVSGIWGGSAFVFGDAALGQCARCGELCERDGWREFAGRSNWRRSTPEAALEEELFLGLRQLDGIDVSQIESAYAVNLASRFDPLASSGLVERKGSNVRLAPSRIERVE